MKPIFFFFNLFHLIKNSDFQSTYFWEKNNNCDAKKYFTIYIFNPFLRKFQSSQRSQDKKKKYFFLQLQTQMNRKKIFTKHHLSIQSGITLLNVQNTLVSKVLNSEHQKDFRRKPTLEHRALLKKMTLSLQQMSIQKIFQEVNHQLLYN